MEKKEKIFKVFFSILLCLLTVVICAVNAAAYIECDGKLNLYEWDEYEQTVLFDHEGISGNAYHSLVVRHKYIDSDRRVYLGISMEFLNDKIDNMSEDIFNEIYISFNSSSEIVLCSDMTSDFNEDEFYLDFGYSADNFGGCTYEVECVLKELEYDNIITMNIQLADHNGDISQVYQIKIKSEELKEEESVSEAESIKEAERESKEAVKDKTTKKSSRTTKVRTTKAKTTKQKETTTEFITAIITEPYEEYSKVLEKNNRSTVIIGAACVVSSVAAMCVALFKKDKK